MNLLYFLFLILLGIQFSFNNVVGLKAEKINGGSTARLDMFKYVAAIMYKLPGLTDQNPCTGGIMNSFYVITAAHCFFDEIFRGLRHAQYYVTAGTNNLCIDFGWTRHISVKTVMIPKMFNRYAPRLLFSTGNLAVLKLAESLQLTLDHPKLSGLMLHSKNSRTVNRAYFVASYGWGSVELIIQDVNGKIEYVQKGAPDFLLRYAKANVISDEKCRQQTNENIPPDFMCVKMQRNGGRGSVGLCKADSGAPLVSYYFLDGIAINGPLSCDEEEMPGVYVNTSEHKKFIEDAIFGRKSDNMHILEIERDNLGIYMFTEPPVNPNVERESIIV